VFGSGHLQVVFALVTIGPFTSRAYEEKGARIEFFNPTGAPVTASYAEQVGADAYAPDASRAVSVARSLIV
jgi:methanogenic corrinoid protein MtbC1